MKVSELIERLSELPEHREVMVGPTFVTEVREVSRVVRDHRRGGQGIDASVVVVID